MTWFALSFKGALLVVVNLLGVKRTGRLQVGIVVVMLAVMAWFVGGAPTVDRWTF